MKLTKRLQTICSLVNSGSNVVDIGCDHGLIDIYLTLYNNNNCIASDINNNALEFAKNNIKKYHLEDKIPTIISDGLNNIDIPNNNTIIICGMGTSTILRILENSKNKKIDSLIVQSNNDLYLLRKSITKLGYNSFKGCSGIEELSLAISLYTGGTNYYFNAPFKGVTNIR